MLVASSLGVACGASPVPFNSLGSFTLPVTQEFGWGRGEMQLAIMWFTVAVVLTVPFVGALADRMGVRRVAIGTLILFGVCFATIGLTPASLPVFYLLWFINGALGGGSTPVTWTRAVNAWFQRKRGIALAATLLGTGLTGMFLPTLATWLIGQVGWRWAYAFVALLPLGLALPFALAWFREPPRIAGHAEQGDPRDEGFTLAEAARSYRFWVLAFSVFVVAVGVGGSITNFQPLLADHGFSAAHAARIAGVIGLSVVAGRLIAGYLIDHWWAPGITFPMLVLPALACVLLAQAQVSADVAYFCAACIGLAAGAETDLVAFLTARYFGLRHYGRIYGVQYSGFGLASGISPWLFGRVYDMTGSYRLILFVASAFFFMGAVLLLTMGRYPRTFATQKSA